MSLFEHVRLQFSFNYLRKRTIMIVLIIILAAFALGLLLMGVSYATQMRRRSLF